MSSVMIKNREGELVLYCKGEPLEI